MQVLFFEQEKGSKTSSRVAAATEELLSRPKQRPSAGGDKLRRSESTRSKPKVAETINRDDYKMKTSELIVKKPIESRRKVVHKGDGEEVEPRREGRRST